MVDSFDMGGAESQTVLLARLLLADGRYGVHLACLRREGALLRDVEKLDLGEIPEFRLTSFYDYNMLVQLRAFTSFLRSRQIDVVHPQSFYTNVFAISGATLARVPARIAFRGETTGWRNQMQDFVERCSYRLAHLIHANSRAVRDFLIQQGVPEKKIAVVHNGLDMSRVTVESSTTREQARRLCGLPNNRLFVTLVANMRHQVKNHQMFIRMAQRVHEVVPEAGFVLAGEGELVPEIRAHAAELGIAEDTFFIGRCDDIAKLLFASDVCVLTSRAEGFSNSILEYMAAARPVVATDVGGAREAIVHGESGYLVPSDDDEAMAKHVVSLLHDQERARDMGNRGHEIVVEKFSDGAQLRNTTAMYERILAGSRRPASQAVKHPGAEPG